jgi:hypothetical protein
MDHYFDYADPQGTSRFRNRLIVSGADTVRVTVSVHAVESKDKTTGKVCALPDPDSVDVPAEVAAIWASKPPPYPVRAVFTRTVAVSKYAGCGSCL